MARSESAANVAVIARAGGVRTAVSEALDGLNLPIDASQGVCVAVGLGVAAFVDPVVLDETFRWLADHGARSPATIAVIPQRDRDACWDVETLAVRHGFSPTRLVDSWSFTAPASAGGGHVIDGRPFPTAWQEAGLRIVLAPCATDAIDGHVLILDVLRHLPPLVPGADPSDIVTDILQTMPPEIVILDASITSDGLAGSAVRRPLRTDTVVASTSAVLAEVVGATLLGVDALRSPLLASVVGVTGLPEDYRIVGDLTAFPGLTYPPEGLLRSTQAASPNLARVLSAAMVDEQTAHDDDIVMAYLRQQVRPYLVASLDQPSSASALAWSASSAATVAGFVDAFRTTFAKDSVPRQVASLGLDLSRYSARDYEAAESTLRPLLQLIDSLTPDRDGLRWTHLNGAVIFEASRLMAAPYAMWVERVDVSSAISTMADYLGGCVVVATRDKEGRPLRQAERNIYLPQPNYASFSGGRVIDVCKLSVMRYRADSCEIWWRTVRSPNDSAVHDDGTVSFSDAGNGMTLVTIRGRQHFTLPAMLQALDLDLQPDLRNTLTDDAYRRFFSTTLDNFEACYEGRDYAIGAEPTDELATLGLSRLARLAGESAKDWLAGAERDAADLRITTIDDSGFTHVAGSRR